jgi:hypothetical protein
MIILTDCDGVLLSWVHSFEWWMKRKGYKPCAVSYNVSEQYGISQKHAADLVEVFCESAAIGYLPPLKDAIKYVRKLHEEQGAVFHCITSIGIDPYAVKLREHNLNRVFGETVFERIHCLPCGADKTEALKRYEGSGFVWVEDKLENANLGAQMGLRSFLINHPYNEMGVVHDDVTRVNNWKEICEHIADC